MPGAEARVWVVQVVHDAVVALGVVVVVAAVVRAVERTVEPDALAQKDEVHAHLALELEAFAGERGGGLVAGLGADERDVRPAIVGEHPLQHAYVVDVAVGLRRICGVGM